jgi:hypothetical protein
MRLGVPSRSGLVLIALVAVTAGACDQATSEVNAMTMQYLGAWQIVSGQQTVDCGNGPMAPVAITAGTVVIGMSQPPGTLSAQDTEHGNCLWFLNAGPTTATFRGGTQCTSTATTTTQAVTPKDYVLTLLSTNQAKVTSNFQRQALGETCTQLDQEMLVLQ